MIVFCFLKHTIFSIMHIEPNYELTTHQFDITNIFYIFVHTTLIGAADMGQRTRDRLLRGSDFLFSFFVVHPLNVFYWRGTWDLYDLYVFPGDSPKQQLRSFSICLLVGSTIYLLSMTVLPLMEQYAQPKGRWRHLDVVTRRLFMYIFLFGVIGYWRGLWGLVDLCLGTGMRDAVIVYAIVPVTAWVVRGSRGTMSTPFGVQHDTCRDFYKGVPRFKSEVSVSSCPFWFGVVVLISFQTSTYMLEPTNILVSTLQA